MKRDNFSSGREWSYKNIVPRIIVEEYLEEENNFLMESMITNSFVSMVKRSMLYLMLIGK